MLLLQLNAVITIAIRLRYECDPTTMRLRYDYPTMKRLRSDYDVSRAPASIRREQKRTRQFFVVVVYIAKYIAKSNANHNFDLFRRSRMSRGIVVS